MKKIISPIEFTLDFDTSETSVDHSTLPRRRILPSAEDIYISLLSEELNFIGQCRLAQAEEDEFHASLQPSSASGSTSGFPNDEDWALTSSEESTDKNGESCSIFSSDAEITEEVPRQRRIIHPESDLSNPFHIPPHIEAYEKSLEEQLEPRPQQKEKNSNGRGSGLIGHYSRARNTVDISMRVFGPHSRSDSIFKFIIGKFRDQHRLK